MFGTKRAILTELVDARVVGDDDAGSLPGREDWQAMEREPDPGRQVAHFAAIATHIGVLARALLDEQTTQPTSPRRRTWSPGTR